jgi:peptidyl-prolyl cis-trans isomerase B (cyclophilin B)
MRVLLIIPCACAGLVLWSSGALAQIDPTRKPGAGAPGLTDVPGTLHTAAEYASSALALIHTQLGGAEAEIYRAGRLTGRAYPLGPKKTLFLCRIFGLPGGGEDVTFSITRVGSRPSAITLRLHPRDLVRTGVFLASRYEADRILYTCPGRGAAAIAAVLPDSSGREVLIDTPDNDTEPAVAPDGYRVAFCTGAPGQRGVALFDRRTRRVSELVRDPEADNHRPDWLDDGTLIYQKDARGWSHIVARDPDGEEQRLLSGLWSDADPAPCRERGTVLFATTRFAAPGGASPPTKGWDIAEGDPRTGAVHRLTTRAGDERGPLPRPGGRDLACAVSVEQSLRCLLVPSAPTPNASEELLPGDGSPLAWTADGEALLVADGQGVKLELPGSDWAARPLPADALPGGARWGRFARLGSDTPVVVVDLDSGPVLVELDASAAPETVRGFLDLVDQGFYQRQIVHRVDAGFVVQMGCPLGNGTGDAGSPAPVERSTLPLSRGALAMEPLPEGQSRARFFIALSDLAPLRQPCTVFGRVVSGMERLDRVLAGDAVHSIKRMVFDEDEVERAAG